MVQLKRDLPEPDPSMVDNTYWAIGEIADHVFTVEQRFEKKNYIHLISQPLSARVVTDHANRKEHGFLNYENCAIAELEAFIKTRHLDLPSETSHKAQTFEIYLHFRNTPGRDLRRQEHARTVEAMLLRGKKASHIAVLQAADDAFVFDKFFDLPPELRSTVYQKYCEDFPPLALPHQPPLTLASRLLRREALPVFYEQSTFCLTFTVRLTGSRAEPKFAVYTNKAARNLLASKKMSKTALS
jgi:hypothetical protein